MANGLWMLDSKETAPPPVLALGPHQLIISRSAVVGPPAVRDAHDFTVRAGEAIRPDLAFP